MIYARKNTKVESMECIVRNTLEATIWNVKSQKFPGEDPVPPLVGERTPPTSFPARLFVPHNAYYKISPGYDYVLW